MPTFIKLKTIENELDFLRYNITMTDLLDTEKYAIILAKHIATQKNVYIVKVLDPNYKGFEFYLLSHLLEAWHLNNGNFNFESYRLTKLLSKVYPLSKKDFEF